MVRLQRVTVLALHNYLGLTNELFSHVSSSHTCAHTHARITGQSCTNIWGWFSISLKSSIVSLVQMNLWSCFRTSAFFSFPLAFKNESFHSPLFLFHRKCTPPACYPHRLTWIVPVRAVMANALAACLCQRSTVKLPWRMVGIVIISY